jgi:hypothetical protein
MNAKDIQTTIGEIEKLIKSLNQEIAKWEVKNYQYCHRSDI